MEELRHPRPGNACPTGELGSLYTFTFDCGSHSLGPVEELDDGRSTLSPLLPDSWLAWTGEEHRLRPVLTWGNVREFSHRATSAPASPRK